MRLHAKGHQVWRPRAASGGEAWNRRSLEALGGTDLPAPRFWTLFPELGEDTSLLFGPEDTPPAKGLRGRSRLTSGSASSPHGIPGRQNTEFRPSRAFLWL